MLDRRNHQTTKPHFGAAFSLLDRPFHRSAHRQHSDADQVFRRTSTEFREPIVVNSDTFPLIFGIGNSEQRQAKARIHDLSFNVIEALVDDSSFEIISTRAGLLVTTLLASFDSSLFLVVNHRAE